MIYWCKSKSANILSGDYQSVCYDVALGAIAPNEGHLGHHIEGVCVRVRN
mgnify:CR=1 FL=1